MSPRVLVVNKFLHHVGGVETYVKWLSEHLSGAGLEVSFIGMPAPAGSQEMTLSGQVHFTPFRDYHGPPLTRVVSAADSIYSLGAAKTFRRVVEHFRPDVVHFHSTCYQLTSSVVRTCMKLGVPAVTTAHEYSLVCSNQRLWDDGAARPCTKCVGASVAQRMGNILETNCVKSSRGASTIAALELPVSHAVWSSYRGLVHAPSEFMFDLLSAPTSPVAGRVRYLDLSWGRESLSVGSTDQRTVSYLGRLSREKGVGVLLAAWPRVTSRLPDARLNIFGSGDQGFELRDNAVDLTGVTFRGRYDAAALTSILSESVLTVHPSEWAENSPYSVRESLQCGVPAIVTDVGGMPEMVGPDTGTVIPASDPGALAEAIVAELTQPRARTRVLRDAVRARALTDHDHLSGLRGLYSEAAHSVGRADVFN